MSWAFMDSHLGIEFEDLSLGRKLRCEKLCASSPVLDPLGHRAHRTGAPDPVAQAAPCRKGARKKPPMRCAVGPPGCRADRQGDPALVPPPAHPTSLLRRDQRADGARRLARCPLGHRLLARRAGISATAGDGDG
jgi:hypothetical protein